MVGLLVSWIQLLDSAGSGAEQAAPEASDFQLVAVSRPAACATAACARCQPPHASAAPAVPHMGSPALGPGQHSAVSMLQEVVKQQFDPDRFTGIFSKGGTGPPKWLDGIIAHRHAGCGARGSGLSPGCRCTCAQVCG